MIRKIVKRLIIAFTALILTLSALPAGSARAGETLDFNFEMTAGQTEARLILDRINSVRTSGNAWYWNPDDQTKTEPGVLSALTYNYDLEKVAMQRAAELAVRFSHTRPSGGSWLEVYSQFGVGTSGVAENIAKGYKTEDSAFEAWLEEDKPYSGQGHRRSILGNYTSIGVGHVICDGVHFWTLELSNAGYSGSAVAAFDGRTVFTVGIDSDDIDGIWLVPDVSDGRASLYDEDATELIGSEIDCRYTLSANCGETFSLSGCSLGLDVSGTERTALLGTGPAFYSDNPEAVNVSGAEVTALGEGVSVLSCSYLGFTLNLPVIVSHDYDEGFVETLAGCTEPGTIVYTCRGCGDAYVDVIPPTGHSYAQYVIRATANEDGAVGQICENCGQTADVTVIKKIGSVSLEGTEFSYRAGKRIRPAAVVLNSEDTAIDPSNYTVKYKGATKVGTAKATVTFNDVLYSGEFVLDYVINPKATSFAKLTPKKGAIGFKWTRVIKQNTGYEIEYSTNKNFKKSEILTISDRKKKTFTLRGLKNKKMYYVRIRTYHVKNGVIYRSSWSGVRTVRTG